MEIGRSKYSIPKPNGDHWDIILERLLKKDKFQCDAWKDEVQNLLIFAGLFSAVVTGFVVESYKSLQPDPNVALAVILSHIAASVDSCTNPSDVVTPLKGVQPYPVPFSPAQSPIQINIFWFSSLILSLTTVIIGIVSLQWLREHQRYTEPLTSKQALAVFHMRSSSLQKWRVPHIFSALPLLLQAALLLFFAGLVEFLLALSFAVAIPAILLMGLSILFLIGTTILPTLQLFTANFVSMSGNSIPAQCAYKSPQSWIFQRLFLYVIRVPVLFWRNLPRSINWPVPAIVAWKKLQRMASWVRATIFRKNQLHSTPVNLDAEHSQNWVDLDISWLTLRDIYFLSQQGEPIENNNISPTYDLVHALASSAQEHSVQNDIVFAAYHAYKELCDTLINDNESVLARELDDATVKSMTRARLAILQSSFSPYRSAYFQRERVNLRVVRDETLFLFLISPGIKEYSGQYNHPAGIHKMELVTRMLVYNFLPRNKGLIDTRPDPIYWFIFQEKYVERLWEVPQSFLEDIAAHHYVVLKHIFEQASIGAFGTTNANSTIRGYSILSSYFHYIASFRPPHNLETDFLGVLETISKGLLCAIESQGYDKADFLFFCGRLYMERVAHHLWFSDAMQFGSYTLRRGILDIIKTMLRYEQQVDQTAYSRMESIWRSELHSVDNAPTLVLCTGYQPIPEILVRFIPYEERNPAPEDYVLGFQAHDYIAATGGFDGAQALHLGDEEMIFSTRRSSIESGSRSASSMSREARWTSGS